MLNKAIAKADLAKTLVSSDDFQPIPAYEDRERWAALDPEIRAYYGALGQQMQGCAWPELPAALYMDFIRNGNRSRFEAPYFVRRRQLYALLVAECVEGAGRLVDDLINGAWAICEESTWVLPAHNNNPRNKPVLGDPDKLVDLDKRPLNVDLFAAETGSLLSWVVKLLGKRLDAESPILVRRIRREVDERILAPFLERDDLWWMGLAHEDPVNNWNPWINSNILAAALNLEKDAARRAALVEKVGRSSQRFLDFYEPDGGCDEGPGYFNVAGASLLDVLMLLDDATNGAVSIYQEPLIRNMGKYIMHTHIADQWHVNFADAAARVRPDAVLLWRAGEKTDEPDLVAYAKSALARGFAALPYEASQNTVYRRLRNLFEFHPQAYEGARPVESREHYFPGIQVVTARSEANSTKGLFLAAKGGTNGESHNHNDIGNYILAVDGEPLVVDAGVYTKFTFNEMRYTLWTMQSGYHNTAVVNGCDQLPGKEYEARSVDYEATEQGVTFALDMAGAYGPEACLERYDRRIAFDRARSQVEVADTMRLTRAARPTVLPLLCGVKPQVEEGVVRLRGAGRGLRLIYDPAKFGASVETITLEDANLLHNWKRPQLYRLLLTRKQAQTEDAYALRFDLED